MIHTPEVNPFYPDETVSYVDIVNTVSFNSVPWEREELSLKEIYPNFDNNCGQGACVISTSDETCLCSVTLDETFVFKTLPSRDDVLSMLKIGALDPAITLF